ncbi:MAG: hypothetical protein WC855_14410 [Thermodesulfovibrionales bacterium]
MKILLLSPILFLMAFILQLIIWKIRIPKRQIKVLLVIFFGTLFTGLLTLKIAPFSIPGLAVYSPRHPLEYLHISISFISLTLAYMITYSAIEADSPSLVMIRAVAKAGLGGLDKKEFEKTMNDELLVIPRVRDLLNDKMAYIDGDKYRLTPKGFLFARLFVLSRKILNAPKGG